MSISNLFRPNDYDLFCDNLEHNNLTVNGNATIGNLDVITNIDTATLTATGTANLNDLNVTTNIDAATIVTTGIITGGNNINATGNINGNQIISSTQIRGTQWQGGGTTACEINNAGFLRRPTGDHQVAAGVPIDLSLDTTATYIDSTAAGASLNLAVVGSADYQYKTILIEAYGNPVTATSASLNLIEPGLTITFTGVGQNIVLMSSTVNWYILSSRGVTIV